jgi:hypothetical protein
MDVWTNGILHTRTERPWVVRRQDESQASRSHILALVPGGRCHPNEGLQQINLTVPQHETCRRERATLQARFFCQTTFLLSLPVCTAVCDTWRF